MASAGSYQRRNSNNPAPGKKFRFSRRLVINAWYDFVQNRELTRATTWRLEFEVIQKCRVLIVEDEPAVALELV